MPALNLDTEDVHAGDRAIGLDMGDITDLCPPDPASNVRKIGFGHESLAGQATIDRFSTIGIGGLADDIAHMAPDHCLRFHAEPVAVGSIGEAIDVSTIDICNQHWHSIGYPP